MLKKIKELGCGALLAAIVVALSGCSHNIVTYGDGGGFETTLRPDSGNFGVTFRYGKILSIAARENFEAEMAGSGKGDAADGKGGASSDGSVKVKIGKQITGYYVDAIKAGATPEKLDGYLQSESGNASITRSADASNDRTASIGKE